MDVDPRKDCQVNPVAPEYGAVNNRDDLRIQQPVYKSKLCLGPSDCHMLTTEPLPPWWRRALVWLVLGWRWEKV